jgi:hypothetical protein
VRRALRRVLYFSAGLECVKEVEASGLPFREIKEVDKKERNILHLNGYYLSTKKSLKKFGKVVRKFFKPKIKYRKKTNRLFNKYSKNYDEIVGVHIRHGDYRKWDNGRHYFDFYEYRQAILNMEEKKRLFLVVSNMHIPEHVYTNIFSDIPYIKGPGSEIEDLYCLSKCDKIVGPVSTFNIWASFLGKVPRYELRRSGKNVNVIYQDVSNTCGEMMSLFNENNR